MNSKLRPLVGYIGLVRDVQRAILWKVAHDATFETTISRIRTEARSIYNEAYAGGVPLLEALLGELNKPPQRSIFDSRPPRSIQDILDDCKVAAEPRPRTIRIPPEDIGYECPTCGAQFDDYTKALICIKGHAPYPIEREEEKDAHDV